MNPILVTVLLSVGAAVVFLFGAVLMVKKFYIKVSPGEALYEICRGPNAGQCSMYVAGVLDGLFYARSRDGSPDFCPAPMNNHDAASVLPPLETRIVERPVQRAVVVAQLRQLEGIGHAALRFSDREGHLTPSPHGRRPVPHAAGGCRRRSTVGC